jgi:hypothetical protein
MEEEARWQPDSEVNTIVGGTRRSDFDWPVTIPSTGQVMSSSEYGCTHMNLSTRELDIIYDTLTSHGTHKQWCNGKIDGESFLSIIIASVRPLSRKVDH